MRINWFRKMKVLLHSLVRLLRTLLGSILLMLIDRRVNRQQSRDEIHRTIYFLSICQSLWRVLILILFLWCHCSVLHISLRSIELPLFFVCLPLLTFWYFPPSHRVILHNYHCTLSDAILAPDLFSLLQIKGKYLCEKLGLDICWFTFLLYLMRASCWANSFRFFVLNLSSWMKGGVRCNSGRIFLWMFALMI